MKSILLGYARFTKESETVYWCQPLDSDQKEVEQVDGPFFSLADARYELERSLRPGWYIKVSKKKLGPCALLLEIRERR